MSEPEQDNESNPTPPTSKNQRVRLQNLFLDPNNYRFVDLPDYVEVPLESVSNADVQRRTASFLTGRSNEGVSDLIVSFRKNGWLPVDQIQVQDLGRGKYLVVEGNRRVAALKSLKRRYDDSSIDLGALDPDFFDRVPVVRYDSEDAAHHKIIMGLGHIAGKKRWPPLNQARLIRSLIIDEEMSEDDVASSLSITKYQLRSMLRTLALCDLYRESDFGDQFESRMYNLFREIIRNRAIGRWIGWDDYEQRPANMDNANRLFAWVSREPALDEDEVELDELDTERDLDGPLLDPIIVKSSDIRELAKFIDDPAALRTLEETRQLREAAISSDLLVEDKISEALNRIRDSAGVLFAYSTKMEDEALSKLGDVSQQLEGVFAAAGVGPRLLSRPSETAPLYADPKCHFSRIRFDQYKGFSNFELNDLSRVNLVVGFNNAGKTSLLEGVQTLVCQNDLSELFRAICRRAKVSRDPPPTWLAHQIPIKSSVSGTFGPDSHHVEVVIEKEQRTADISDSTFYVTSIHANAAAGDEHQSAIVDLFERRAPVTHLDRCQKLCPIVYSSPFIRHETSFLVDLFNQSVEQKTKDQVIRFIQEQIDRHFKDVNSINEENDKRFTRFLVDHDNFDSAVDLTQFGQGIQRVFHIGLMFAMARGGIVLIDELENAIHFSLLIPFTRFMQEMAVQYNCQVFATSHSKECIDAFVYNDYRMKDISAFALRNEDRGRVGYRYSGAKLEELLEFANLDIRGEMA